jgi:hypothetical protein
MFRATGAAAMKYTGTSLEKLAEAAGPGFKNAVESAGKSIEERVSQRKNFPSHKINNLRLVSSGG